MEYRMNLGAWNSVFAVPCEVVDRHLKLAGALQLKVLLWALRHSGEAFTTAALAEATGASEADVRDAMLYWTENGLFCTLESQTQTQLAPNPAAPAQTSAAPVQAPAASTQKKAPARIRHPRPDPVYIAARMSDSEEIRYLMEEAQTIMGNVLSPAMSSLLLYICDDLGIPPEVILMLLHYAKSIGKANTSYLESAARDWAENNIFTLADAERKLKQLDEHNRAWKRVEAVIEINPRSPSKRELNYATQWICEWKFDDQLLRMAYEICVNSIQKLDFKYMDAILRRWHDNGIVTPAQAVEDQQRQQASRSKAPKSGPTYDIEDFEKMNLLDLQGNN